MSVIASPERYEVARRRELRAVIEQFSQEMPELLERLRQFHLTNFVKFRAGLQELDRIPGAVPYTLWPHPSRNFLSVPALIPVPIASISP